MLLHDIFIHILYISCNSISSFQPKKTYWRKKKTKMQIRFLSRKILDYIYLKYIHCNLISMLFFIHGLCLWAQKILQIALKFKQINDMALVRLIMTMTIIASILSTFVTTSNLNTLITVKFALLHVDVKCKNEIDTSNHFFMNSCLMIYHWKKLWTKNQTKRLILFIFASYSMSLFFLLYYLSQ